MHGFIPEVWKTTRVLIEQICQSIPLLGIRGTGLTQVRDPDWLEKTFRAAQIPYPMTLHCDSTGAWGNSAAKKRDRERRWLRKPIRSAAGNRIEFVDPKNAAISSDYYLQEFLIGPIFSGIFVASNSPENGADAELVGVTRQWTNQDLHPSKRMTSHAFRYVGSSGPIVLPDHERGQWERIGQVLVKESKLSGLFGVDAVVANTKSSPTVYPIEVNPRYTASAEILERAFRTSLIPRHLDSCLGSNKRFVAPPRDQYWGKRIHFAATSISKDATFDTMFPAPFGTTAWQLADMPFHGTKSDELMPQAIHAGEPILTTIAGACSLDNVEKALGFRRDDQS